MSTFTGAAMRLEDYAKLSRNNVAKGLVSALYETQSILKDVPFVNDPSLKATGVRIAPGGLPAATYGQLNTTPALARTTFEQHEETAFLIRQNITMDVRYRDMKNLVVNPVKVQTLGLMEAWARQLNTDFINNDPASADGNKLAPTGLRVRLSSTANRAKYGHAPDCAIDGSTINAGGINVSPSMSKLNAIQLFAAIDRMLMYLNSPDGNGVVLYMNTEMFLAFSIAAKMCDGGSGLATTKDNYDRTITTYKGAKLRDIGRTSDDITPIIGSNEAADGSNGSGSDHCTSIYAVRYGDTYCTGWHDGKMDLDYVGTDDTGTQDIWLLDYQAGVYHAHSRTVARLYGIKLA